MANKLFTIDPQIAFNNALEKDVFSHLKDAPQWAGDYMYMYTKHGTEDDFLDHFKHIDTRVYRRVTRCSV